MKLIENWRDFPKFWSVRLSVIGSALLSVFIIYPEAMLHVWAILPDDLKTFVPPRYTQFISLSVIIAGVIARIIKQEELNNDAGHSEERQEKD